MVAKSKVRKIAKKRTAKKKDTKLNVSPGLGLELDGTVYIVELDADDNVISRSPIDGKSVLDAIAYVLSEMMKQNKNP